MWLYKGKEFTELPPNIYGFIYLIEYTNGQMYIGKKKVITEVTKPALKNGKCRPNSRRIGKNISGCRKYFDVVTSIGKWEEYEGSSKLTEDLAIKSKTILHLASNKRTLTYLEVMEQFERDVLFSDKYINLNIGGLYFDNALEGYIKDV